MSGSDNLIRNVPRYEFRSTAEEGELVRAFTPEW